MNIVPLNIFTLPVWWYTTGLTIIWQWFVVRAKGSLHNTGLVLFARHLKEPLYGDYTRSGIVISFFLRIALLVVKLVWVGFRIAGAFVFVLLYLAVIPLSIIMILYQLVPLS